MSKAVGLPCWKETVWKEELPSWICSIVSSRVLSYRILSYRASCFVVVVVVVVVPDRQSASAIHFEHKTQRMIRIHMYIHTYIHTFTNSPFDASREDCRLLPTLSNVAEYVRMVQRSKPERFGAPSTRADDRNRTPSLFSGRSRSRTVARCIYEYIVYILHTVVHSYVLDRSGSLPPRQTEKKEELRNNLVETLREQLRSVTSHL